MPQPLDPDLLERAGALWRHGGDPAAPHARLASGRHSAGYLNLSAVVSRPALLSGTIVPWWQQALTETGETFGADDWVLSSAMGGVIVAYALGYALGTRAGFTEKAGDAMALMRFEPPAGTRVLLCEDVLTTGSTTVKTLAALAPLALAYAPVLPCIVNRTGNPALEVAGATRLTFRLLAPFSVEFETWDATACPLCAAGSEAVKPKAHWRRLRTGRA